MLNDSQFERLAAYEKYMKTAIDSSYPRSPGPRGLREIHAVLREVDPQTPTLNTTCGTCILRLLKKAGRLYFDRKAADEKDRAEAVAKTIEDSIPDKVQEAIAAPSSIQIAMDAEQAIKGVESARQTASTAAKAVKSGTKSGTKSTKKPAKK